MRPRLKQSQQDVIAGAVKDARMRTQGEIVTVLACQSDHYTAVAMAASLILTGIAAAAAHYLHPYYLFTTMSILELTVFFFLFTIFESTGLHIFLVPLPQKLKAVRRLAQEQFLNNHLHMTPDRASILILISQREKRVELIADHGIAAREAADIWEIIMQRLTENMRSTSLTNAVKEAIEDSVAILEKHYPAK